MNATECRMQYKQQHINIVTSYDINAAKRRVMSDKRIAKTSSMVDMLVVMQNAADYIDLLHSQVEALTKIIKCST